MSRISNVGVQAQPQPQKTGKVAKHLANAGVTAAGVAGVTYGTKKVCEAMTSHVYKSSAFKPASMLTKKIANNFLYWGNKLMPEGGKAHKFFNNTTLFLNKQLPKAMRYDLRTKAGIAVKNKANYLLKGAVPALALGAATILALVTRAIYKAGKINGEAKQIEN